jgi:hypothetical protein
MTKKTVPNAGCREAFIYRDFDTAMYASTSSGMDIAHKLLEKIMSSLLGCAHQMEMRYLVTRASVVYHCHSEPSLLEIDRRSQCSDEKKLPSMGLFFCSVGEY